MNFLQAMSALQSCSAWAVRRAAVIGALLLLIGCTPFRPLVDDGRFFTMRPMDPVSLPSDAPTVRLETVQVPPYLDGRKMTFRRNNAEIAQSANRLWSQPFADDVRATLRAYLRVLGVDARPERPVSLGSLSVVIDRFEATETGEIRLEATWIWTPAPDETPQRHRFEADGSWTPPDHASLASGKSTLMRAFAETIASRLRTQP